VLAKGRNLDIVTQSQIIDGFAALKSDLWKVACGFYLLELVDAFTVEGSEKRDVFVLVLDALRYLCKDDDGDTVLRHFELHLLGMVGYCPQLHRCVGCGSAVESRYNFFSRGQGGLLCSRCESGDVSSLPLSLSALKVLRLWQKSSYPESRRIKIDGKLAGELQQVMSQYIGYILQREVKSMKWLQELKKFSVDNTGRGVYNARQSSRMGRDGRSDISR
jgi:DNA repair protein RecO (recombination protein O)